MPVNSFLDNVPILYPQKTTENQRFSVIFRGCKMSTWVKCPFEFVAQIYWFLNLITFSQVGKEIFGNTGI